MSIISFILALFAFLDDIRHDIMDFRRSRHSITAKAINNFSDEITYYNKIMNTSKDLTKDKISFIKMQLIGFVGRWAEVDILTANVNTKIIRKSLPNLKMVYVALNKATFINNKDKRNSGYYKHLHNFKRALEKCDIIQCKGGNKDA